MKSVPIFVTAISVLVLSACATKQEFRPHSWALAVQTAETRAAHEQLADHYEEIAATMDADAAEERAMLQQYQASPHKYGKRILDLRAEANAMIRDFEMAAAESRKMAQYHRQMAAEQDR